MPNEFYYTYPRRIKIVARVGTRYTLPSNQVCVSPGRLSSYERNNPSVKDRVLSQWFHFIH